MSAEANWDYLIKQVESLVKKETGNKVLLPLNPYQAANLLWFMKRVWLGNGNNPIHCPNSGDWYGEIPQILENAMKDAGGDFLTQYANGGGYGGRKPFANPIKLRDGHYGWECEHDPVWDAISRKSGTCPKCQSVTNDGGTTWFWEEV